MDDKEVMEQHIDIEIEATGNIGFVSKLEKRMNEEVEAFSAARRPRADQTETEAEVASIFKVHDELRNTNPNAYTPLIVSIGPYHHPTSRESKLSAMEKHKLRFLHSFLQTTEKSLESCFSDVEKYADRARSCYADLPPHPDSQKRHEFVEMMVVDACFVIQFLLQSFTGEIFRAGEKDPIFQHDWMVSQILRDLLLLENQIPFFLLAALLPADREGLLIFLAKAFISSKLPNVKFSTFGSSPPPPKQSIAGRFFKFLSSKIKKQPLPSTYQSLPSQPSTQEKEKEKDGQPKHFLDLVVKACVPPDQMNVKEEDDCYEMRCVTELQQAGIHFEANEREEATLLDIRFDPGHPFKGARFQIPKFTLQDDTEILYRNLIAYEQHSVSINPKYFTDYVSMMDLLINTQKDANILRLKGIIQNMLGTDEEVAGLFNRLGVAVIITPPFYYSLLCRNANRHCSTCWNQLMATLRREYFNTPWAVVSTIAAAILLVMTTTLTVISLLNAFS